MSKTKKIVITSITVFLTFSLLMLPFGVFTYLYNEYFGTRYETYEPLSFSMEDFPGLKRDKYEFSSDKGQTLVGYNYYHENEKTKGIIIIAHGFGGGGHNLYMDCANYFAKNGYYVFAYDATGNDESEGDSVNGLPQGVIDLDYAISFVESQEKFKDLPIMLFGHSWGGYSVTSVLSYHPEIKAVVSMSGFNESSDLIKSQGESIVGSFIEIGMPYIEIYEKIKFGEYAINTSMDGFEKSDAGVMIMHSEDDDTVQKKYGYDIYYAKYNSSERFKFISYEDKGHDEIYYSDTATEYINQFNKEFELYFEEHEFSPEAKTDYINENLDRTVWTNLLDEELFNSIIEFYDSYI
ncbi:MAG: alpha/beta fold hydrolase [Clostridia bacterium]|nr:alpha/beta fold hydrolase [Clostridia bacterium]